MTTTIANPEAKDFTEIVFENRNREFGAYVMRKRYATAVLISLLIATIVVGLLVAMPYIIKAFADKTVEEPIVETGPRELTNPPPIDKTEPPPPPPPANAPPPVQASVMFTVPEISDEPMNEVTTAEDLTESNPGTVTQEGDPTDFSTSFQEDGTGEAQADLGKPEPIYTYVEQMPEFPGGEKALLQYLKENIKYPAEAKEFGTQGKVTLNFTIDQLGNVSNIVIKKDIGDGCGDEAVRVVKGMPRWKPGKQGGKAVKVSFFLPIQFSLN